jgi:hypothetical protein
VGPLSAKANLGYENLFSFLLLFSFLVTIKNANELFMYLSQFYTLKSKAIPVTEGEGMCFQ